MMKSQRYLCLVSSFFLLASLLLGLPSFLGATPLTINPSLTQTGMGLTIIQAGVGLEGLGVGTETIEITIDGPVVSATLYWAGRDIPSCPLDSGACFIPFEPYLDQELLFDGNPITGTIIGQEGQAPPQNYNNIGYRADVTAIVQGVGLGPQSFSVQDGNTGLNLNPLSGATLLVIYTDTPDTTNYKVFVFDGLDFAFGRNDQLAAAKVTDPVMFNYASFPTARTGDLLLSVGDTDPDRCDRVDISDNTSLTDQLIAADGEKWDARTDSISIPGGVGTTTVQLFSEPIGNFCDSLLWVLGALRIPLECGDGVLDDGEECDDGNTVDTDDCRNDCTIPVCGDGIQDAGEECDDGNTDDTDACRNDCTTVSMGGEGCTPGYWQQGQHLESWVGASPTDLFEIVFGRNAFEGDPTLLLVVSGGATPDAPAGCEPAEPCNNVLGQLAFHAVAAYLNALNPAVSYKYSSSEVIDIFKAAFDSNDKDDMEAAMTDLDSENNQGCPLSTDVPGVGISSNIETELEKNTLSGLEKKKNKSRGKNPGRR